MRDQLIKELRFTTTRSSGPGGQHVNKTESKVTLHWNLEASEALTEHEKALLRTRLAAKLSEDGNLIMNSQVSRSQLQNKQDVTERFLKLIEKLIIPKKKRIRTKPSRAAVERRLKEKKVRADRKKDRGKPDQD